MHHARSVVLTFLLIVVSLAGATTSMAAEDTSPPSATSHEVNVVRQVAIALAAGRDAIKELRGPPIENSNLDRLKLPTPGMDCGIARSVIYVACHSASLNKNEAEAMFARIIDYGQTALPSDSWNRLKRYLTSGRSGVSSITIGSPARKSTSTYWANPQGSTICVLRKGFRMAAHLTATHTTKVELYDCKSIEPRGSSNRQPPTKVNK